MSASVFLRLPEISLSHCASFDSGSDARSECIKSGEIPVHSIWNVIADSSFSSLADKRAADTILGIRPAEVDPGRHRG